MDSDYVSSIRDHFLPILCLQICWSIIEDIRDLFTQMFHPYMFSTGLEVAYPQSLLGDVIVYANYGQSVFHVMFPKWWKAKGQQGFSSALPLLDLQNNC